MLEISPLQCILPLGYTVTEPGNFLAKAAHISSKVFESVIPSPLYLKAVTS